VSPSPVATPPGGRLYVVLTYVPRRSTVAVGALGAVRLERGWYAYVGSAVRARTARVARHLASEKPLRWHADYLFTAFSARRAWLVDGGLSECDLAKGLAGLSGASRVPRGFGAGDCRCAGHLVRFPRRPRRRDIAAAGGEGASVRTFTRR
jgi:Uri superfamily endonuclease